MLRTALFASLVAIAPLAACDDDHDDHSDATPADDACEHLAGGPVATATAEVTPTSAADASGEHQRVDVTLADLGGGMFGGAVTYAADEAGEFIVFLNTDVAVTVTDAAGAAVAPDADETTDPACTEIQRHITFDFEVGTYTLTFAPTTASSLQMVVVHAGDEHDHD